MAITAAQVKELRELTGAGMMDCKKALAETDGNMEAAVDVLRKSGAVKAEKKASRIAAEGICRAAVNGTTGVVVEVNSETDFVAKNEIFQTFVQQIADQALASSLVGGKDGEDVEALLGENGLKEALVDKTATIGEKLSFRRFQKLSGDVVVDYLHGNGRIGVIVAGNGASDDAAKEALKNVAMQIAALHPQYVCDSEVPEEFKEHEIEIIKAQIANDPKVAGKPEKVIEGMIQGKLNKELKEICLNDQVYVKAEDGKQSVAAYLAQVGKANNAKLSVKKFVRFERGEGMEKKQENFAEEVAKQMNM